MRAITLLSVWKFRNGLRTLFTDPRKLIPLTVFVALMVLMIVLGNVGLNQPRPNLTQDHLDPRAFSVGVILSLILVGLSFIDSGLGDSMLALGMPDVDYIFPSPISRRVVLAYRLPALMFGALFMTGFVLMAFNLTTQVARPLWPSAGSTIPPWWTAPSALFLSGGIYMNLAMYLSVRINDRRALHKALMVSVFALGGLLGLMGWRAGLGTVEAVVESRFVHWLFLPSSLASESLIAGYAHHPNTGPLGWLLLGYFVSLIPMFSSNANWYEQSIVSTERLTAFRKAARGGYSALAGARASGYRSTRSKAYTITPFGQGSTALLWAHLCAAAKKPFGNFVGPLIGGVGAGVLGAVATSVNRDTENIGFGALFAIGMYCSMGFLATAKTACESAIRRRELLAPLPISGWKAVAANLGVPFCTIILFFAGCAGAYIVARGPSLEMVGFVFGIALPLRLSARMILQYIIGIGYPDVADKIQQFFAIGVYAIATTPFLVTELILCIPGIVLHSLWTIIISLTLFQIPLIAFLLLLAGKATERATATGEPVRILSLLSLASGRHSRQ